MLEKIKKYYNAFGFSETLKKIVRYIIFKYQTFRPNISVYKLSKTEKKNLVLTNKNVYMFTKFLLFDLPAYSSVRNIAKELNFLGYNVNYYYLKKNSNNRQILNVSLHKPIDENMPINFSKNDFVIFENVYEAYEYYIRLGLKKNSNIILLINYEENEKIQNISEMYSLFNNSKIIYLNEYSKHLIKKELNNLNIKKNLIFNDNFLELYESIIDICKCDLKFYNNISVVILNYNNKSVIKKCLDTLLKNNYKYNYEIIVVDNKSTDGSYEMIKKMYKGIKLYRNSKNGCSSGRNLGVSKATKDYILFLDSDQWVLNKFWLDNYIEIIKKDNIGVGWAAGLFNKKGYSFHTVDNFEYRYMPPLGFYRRDIGYLGTGGLMIKKSFLNKIGGFDENYDPTCYEDTDLSLNIRHNGKEIVYCPFLGVGHLPHQTTKSGSKSHKELIKNKGKYFVNKWNEKNPKLLKYIK